MKTKYIRIGNTFFVGNLRKEDRSVFCKRVYFVDSKFVKSSIQTMLSDSGKADVSSDGVLVVSDVSSVIFQVAETVQKIENSSPGTWVIQFYILTNRKGISLDVGGKVTTSGNIAYNLAKSADDSSFRFSDAETLAQNVDLVLTSKSEFVKLVSAPMFLLRDGSTGKWIDGATTPVPQYSVSSYGVKTVSGYKDYNTGFTLSCKLTETIKGAVLKVDYENSIISGYVDAVPKINKNSLSFDCELLPGAVYLVGELMNNGYSRGVDQLADFSNEDSCARVQIWCKAFRIGKYMQSPVPLKK